MITLKDQFGREITLTIYPGRIISLVPSQTELLSYLKLDAEVVGITKFCVHPKVWYESKTRIGGTKTPDISKIKALEPDLIIANKEENRQEDIDSLTKVCPVYISDVNDFKQAMQMILDIGKLTDRVEMAHQLTMDISASLRGLPKLTGRVLYLIWDEPFMAAGPSTFIGHVIEQLGFENVLAACDTRYIELSEADILKLRPEILLLSSEPFPFNEKHRDKFSAKFDTKVKLVDGEIFSWYGSRMLKMARYFQEHFRPETYGS